MTKLLESVSKHSAGTFQALQSQALMTEAQLGVLSRCFNEVTIEAMVKAIVATKDIFEYQGFSPAVTLKILVAAHLTKYPDDKTSKKLEEENKRIGFNTQDFNTAMSYAIAIFLTRGTNWDSIKKKSVATLAPLMEHLAGVYRIKTSKPKASEPAPDPKVITLARISASLPHITATLFSAGIGRVLMSESKYGVGDFPRILLCPNIASLLSFETSGNAAWAPHNLMVWINYMNDRVLHSKDKKYTDARSLIQYHLAAFNSITSDKSYRKEYSTRLGLLSEEEVYKPAIKAADKAALEKLRALPSGDFHELVPIEA